ncbi:hypothetical protein RCL1_000020 [Eukaryota sp. TZLM3-RCL]
MLLMYGFSNHVDFLATMPQRSAEEQQKLQHERHERHQFKDIDGWLRYGPNQTLPNGQKASGNGVWFNQNTGEIRRFKSSSETNFIFHGPHETCTTGVKCKDYGCDFDLSVNKALEPKHPDDEFYRDKYE